jgi:hypothetical protein
MVYLLLFQSISNLLCTTEIPDAITSNPKFYPFFQDALGAVDGTHIAAKVFDEEMLKLLTAIVDFFDSALEHFSHGIFRKPLIYQVIISRPSNLQHLARHRGVRYRPRRI